MCEQTCIYMYAYLYLCVYAYTCVHMYLCVCCMCDVCAWVCLHMYAFAYTCVHILIHTHAAACICSTHTLSTRHSPSWQLRASRSPKRGSLSSTGTPSCSSSLLQGRGPWKGGPDPTWPRMGHISVPSSTSLTSEQGHQPDVPAAPHPTGAL